MRPPTVTKSKGAAKKQGKEDGQSANREPQAYVPMGRPSVCSSAADEDQQNINAKKIEENGKKYEARKILDKTE